jgi:hypothetical protein
VVPLWQVERDAIEAAIEFYDGNVPRAAAALEISPSTIYRKRQSWSGLRSSNVSRHEPSAVRTSASEDVPSPAAAAPRG